MSSTKVSTTDLGASAAAVPIRSVLPWALATKDDVDHVRPSDYHPPATYAKDAMMRKGSAWQPRTA
jgi:hypothetical protein